MTSNSQSTKSYSKRIFWLAALVTLITAVYTSVWFYYASVIEDKASTVLNNFNREGMRAHCEDLKVSGYPFRVGIDCRSVFFEDTKQGLSFRSGSIKTAAHVYAPAHIFAELQSPASILLPHLSPVSFQWSSLVASMQFDFPYLERISFVGDNLELVPDNAQETVATIENSTFHARIVDQDLQAAFNFSNLILSEDISLNLPTLEGRAMVLVTDGISMIRDHNFNLRGRSGTIEELVVGIPGKSSSLSLAGPISFDADGYINGQFKMKLEDPVGTASVLADIFPDVASHIRSAVGMLTALGNRPIDVKVISGQVFLGIIPIGTLGPI